MFSTFLGDIIIVLGFPSAIGVGLIFLADFLKRRRNDEFLYALDHIINKKDYEKKTDKNADE